MNITETAQELLEQLWVAEEESKQPGLPANEVPPAAEELIRQGLATREATYLVLTPSGHPQARAAVRRHRLAERLLADVVASSDAQLDIQACRLEHALFQGVDESICTLLGHPQFCPHGKPIPPGECCRQRRKAVERLIAPLTELCAGDQGTIAYVNMSEPKHAQKLMAMGVLPGVPVTLLRRSPSFVFEAGYSQFAVDEQIAADIHVRLARSSS
jgi:DtxR family Mn-dependent transcriptional regulator